MYPFGQPILDFNACLSSNHRWSSHCKQRNNCHRSESINSDRHDDDRGRDGNNNK